MLRRRILPALVMTIVIALASYVIQSEAQAQRKIAFVSDRDDDSGEIYVMNADGSNPVNVTQNPARDSDPSWSPDGKKIAFASDRDGNSEIYIMNADGSNPVNLTRNPAKDWAPSWSPDGGRIAFVSERDGNTDVYVMNADGSNSVKLTDNAGGDWAPSWSPDGERIAFVSERGDGNFEIYTMNADGGNPVNLTKNPAWDGHPSWSPDGRKIAYASQHGDDFEIHTMNADGSNPVNLTKDERPAHIMWTSNMFPSWSPDGKKIAFELDHDGGNCEIYIIDADGSSSVNLTNNPAEDMRPCWSPGWSPAGLAVSTKAALPTLWSKLKRIPESPLRLAEMCYH